MSNIWKYIAVGGVSALVSGAATYFTTKKILTKKYQQRMNDELDQQKAFYVRKLRSKGLENIINNAVKAEVFVDKSDAVDNEGKPVKIRASEIAQENVVKEDTDKESSNIVNYHKMYDASNSEKLKNVHLDIFDLDEDEQEEYVNPQPYLIRRDAYFGEIIEESRPDFKQSTLIYFTGDFIKDMDGNKTFIPILYSEDEEKVWPADKYVDIIGSEWMTNFGNDTWDDETRTGYDYDRDEVYVRNEVLKTDYYIMRDDRRYRDVILDINAEEPYDYPEIKEGD